MIFCRIIETSDIDDLQLLEDFSVSLQPISAISVAMQHTYHLAHVLFKIAASYIEARKSQPGDLDSNLVGAEFDLYLSQLGFMPSMAEHMPFDGA